MTRSRLITIALLVAVVALFAVPLALHTGTGGSADGRAYAGTDSTAAQVVTQVDPGYRPWFSPLFQPSSGEVESGLFAVQAALGAGVFGFVLGRLSGRRRASGSGAQATPGPDAGTPSAAPAPAPAPGGSPAGPGR
jgi:cobalt/nickel transport protein